MSDIDVISRLEILKEHIENSDLTLKVTGYGFDITKSDSELFETFDNIYSALAFVEGYKDGVMYG